ncbi:MAG: signal peptidase I [Bacteroidota bacterium]|nr:signal peptidase I [Bacteroidota bacterium]
MSLFKKKILRDGGIIIFVTIAAAIILKTYIIGAVCVPTSSMEPTLLIGDHVFINKMIHGVEPILASFPLIRFPINKNIERGDVLLFELPQINSVVSETPLYFLKRCIGLPGDTIIVTKDEVFVNNKKINFPYKQNYDEWAPLIEKEGHRIEKIMDEIYIDGIPAKSYTIEKDYLFVLGDNIQHSYDSRHWGFLNQDKIVGKAIMIYWSISQKEYVQKFSEYFHSVRWDRVGSFIR